MWPSGFSRPVFTRENCWPHDFVCVKRMKSIKLAKVAVRTSECTRRACHMIFFALFIEASSAENFADVLPSICTSWYNFLASDSVIINPNVCRTQSFVVSKTSNFTNHNYMLWLSSWVFITGRSEKVISGSVWIGCWSACTCCTLLLRLSKPSSRINFALSSWVSVSWGDRDLWSSCWNECPFCCCSFHRPAQEIYEWFGRPCIVVVVVVFKDQQFILYI